MLRVIYAYLMEKITECFQRRIFKKLRQIIIADMLLITDIAHSVNVTMEMH